MFNGFIVVTFVASCL